MKSPCTIILWASMAMSDSRFSGIYELALSCAICEEFMESWQPGYGFAWFENQIHSCSRCYIAGSDVRDKLLHTERINRGYRQCFAACCRLFSIVFTFAVVRLEWRRRNQASHRGSRDWIGTRPLGSNSAVKKRLRKSHYNVPC